MIAPLLLAASLASAAEPKLLALPAQPFGWEKVGPLAMLKCPKGEKWDDCGRFESLELQVKPDWEALARLKPGKKEVLAFDQFGGPWKVAVGDAGITISPDFPAYKITGKGADAQVDVLRNDEQFAAAKKELGLDKPKKKGLAKLFE